MVVELLSDRLPVTRDAVENGLRGVSLDARQQIFPGEVERIVDVAHNPHAAERLRDALVERPCKGATRAVFASLADKDVGGIVEVLSGIIDAWYVADAPAPRGARSACLAGCIRAAGAGAPIVGYTSVKEAYLAALDAAGAGDRVVCFGSFHAAGPGAGTRSPG